MNDNLKEEKKVEQKNSKFKEIFKEYLVYVLIIVFIILLRTFIVTPVRVDGNSMNDNLKDGEILLLKKYDKSYERFDIVIFNYKNDKLIKRIIGLPGEKVEYKDNKLYIDGKYVEENMINKKTNDFNLVLVTGDLYYEDVLNELKRCKIDLTGTNIKIKNYIHDMEKYLSAADLVISRSGAIFLSEIAYLGKPSILIPSPNVAENHQEINADAFVKSGAGIKICESELSKNTLKNAIYDIIKDDYKMYVMSHNALKMSKKDATKMIADEVEKLIKTK